MVTRPMTFISSFPLALRLALREMRGGLRGFQVFILCILLGTAAIAGVNSIAASMTDAIHGRGQEILAGDVRFELKQREANTAERAFLNSLGTVAIASNMRSMVRSEDKQRQSLSELKAVDTLYPLYGTFIAEPNKPLGDLLGAQNGVFGAVAQPMLLDRLNAKVGDHVLVGDLLVEIRGQIVSEPDQLSDGFGFAPRLLISDEALRKTGLLQTGSLVDQNYRIKLANPAQKIKNIRDLAKSKFPEAGWAIRGAQNAAPALSDNIRRFSEFLTLVGLAALAAGGVGVANAVSAFLDSKRQVIASFKSLGAPGHMIVTIYLIQILSIAAIAIVGGLVVGTILTPIAAYFLKDFLPVVDSFPFYPKALAIAAAFGLLTTIAFSILPLGKTRLIRATELFRLHDSGSWLHVPWRYYIAAIIAFAAVAALAILTSEQKFLASVFIASTAGAFLVLRLVATAIAAIARRVPRVKSPALRLAIGNIHRPGALTGPVILSLGLGLTLLASLALIEGNLRGNLSGSMVEKAPNFFFIDIQNKDLEGFRTAVKQTAPKGIVQEVPMLRGRILSFNGEDVQRKKVPQEARWVLQGDRGITYSDNVPANSSLSEGTWWDPTYSGEPLVSFADEEGRQLGLKLGDTITVNVLGRNITARIANFRKVEWRSMSINFVMVFSPNTFKGAPHAWLATLTDRTATPQSEQAVMRSVTNAYPGITSIRVKDALDIASGLIAQLAVAVRAAASIAIAVSVLVLAGAIAAGNRARIHDAVVLKTLGAKRTMLMRAYLAEYFLLGLISSIFALAAAGVASWYVITHIMEMQFTFLPATALFTILLALVATAGTGLLGTWSVLGQKAAPILREL